MVAVSFMDPGTVYWREKNRLASEREKQPRWGHIGHAGCQWWLRNQEHRTDECVVVSVSDFMRGAGLIFGFVFSRQRFSV